MKLNTYEILKEFEALEDMLNEVDEVTGEFINSEDDIKEYIDSLENSRDEKLNNIEKVKREIEGSMANADKEIKRLQALKKQRENNINSLTNLEMLLTQGEKIETDLFKFSTRKSKSVVVLDESLIDDKYFRIKKEVNKTEIKKAIETAIKNKESFFGAEIVEKVSLTVK